MHVDDAIRNRRTHKLFDGTQIETADIETLIELATWAPNHKRTEPWRFVVLHGPQRVQALGDAACAGLLDAALGRDDEGLRAKQAKLRTALRGAAAVIAVSYARSPGDSVRDREDFAATACAVQNLMLGATARGIGSLWSTNNALIGRGLDTFWQQGGDHERIGAIVLGRPSATMPAQRLKTVRDVTRWI